MTFTAGILHDAGKLVVGTYLQEQAEALAAALSQEGVTLIAAERSVLGTDHTEVGAMVAEAWRLPGPVCDVIRWHHAPDGAEIDRSLADLLHTADCLAHALSLGADVGELRRGVFEGAMERLQIDVHQLERASSRVIEQVWSLSDLFGAHGGS
jgi:HD-like signal output (HDOD) protein